MGDESFAPTVSQAEDSYYVITADPFLVEGGLTWKWPRVKGSGWGHIWPRRSFEVTNWNQRYSNKLLNLNLWQLGHKFELSLWSIFRISYWEGSSVWSCQALLPLLNLSRQIALGIWLSLSALPLLPFCGLQYSLSRLGKDLRSIFFPEKLYF